jgi:hypothetical protein
MTETYVELKELPVLRIKADWKAGGPATAMAQLESRLPTLKGRKFYAYFTAKPEGEEYFASVARIDTDDPESMRLEPGVIPGGWYARRRLPDWEKDLTQMARLFEEMNQSNEVDPARPSIEFYRSQAEMLLFVPVRGPHARSLPGGSG